MMVATGAGMDLYVYYRVRPEHVSALQAKVAAMQAGLAEKHGIVASLKRRPAIKDGCHTWMEVYAGVAQGFDVLLAQAVSEMELNSLIEGERHAEFFLDLSPCA